MATAWKVAAATAVIRWLVAPVIAHFLPKVMSYLVVDPSEKIRDLKIRILPELEKTLHKVDVARMMREPDRARERASDLSALSDMAAWLRHAREDAEDILDDALEIDLYRNSCWEQIYGAVATCKSSCVRLLQWAGIVKYSSRLYGAVQSSMWIALQWPGTILHRAVVSIRASITRCRSARLLPWARNQFEEPVPSGAASHAHAVNIADSDSEAVPPSNLASHEEAVSESAAFREQVSEATASELASVPAGVSDAMISDSVSDSEAVSEDAPSGLASHEQALVLVPTPSCSFLDVFQNRCRSIFYWLLDKYEKACSLRDWSYEVAGITSYQVRRQSHHPIPYAHACPI
jgi:predicted CoA-binding protein